MTNQQGLTAEEMSKLAEQQMKDRTNAAAIASPNTVQVGGQMGSVQTGTGMTPINYQADFQTGKKSVDTLTSTPANAYISGIDQDIANFTAAKVKNDYANSGQAYTDLNSSDSETRLNAQRSLLQQKEQDLNNYTKQVEGGYISQSSKNAYISQLPPSDPTETTQEKDLRAAVENGGAPGLSAGQALTTLLELRKDRQKFDVQNKNLSDQQTSNTATSNAVAFRMGQSGSSYADASAKKLKEGQDQQKNDLLEQQGKYLDAAKSAAWTGNMKIAEQFRAEASRTAATLQAVSAQADVDQKELLAIQKADSQEGGAIYSLVQTGKKPSELQLSAIDEMRGYRPGTAQMLYEAEKAVFDRNQEKEDRTAYKDNIQIEKDLADLEDRPLDRQSKLLDIQAKLSASKTRVYDEMNKIFTAMKDAPEGLQFNIGDASFMGIDGGAIFEKDQGGNGRLAYQNANGEVQVQNIGNFGKLEDVETVYVDGMQVLRNTKTKQLMPVNIGSSAQPGANVWAEKYPDGSTNPYRPNDPMGKECAGYCNDLYADGKVWGDKLSDKLVQGKPYEVPKEEIQVEDSIVMSTNAQWGHVAIVSQVFKDENGKTMIQLNESNYVPPGGGKISNSRTMSIDDPRLKMVARIPLNPTRSPSSPADSLNSVGDMQLGPPTPKKGQTANPFIIPGRVYTESQQLEADQKWVDAQEGAKNLLNGGSTDDISTDVKSAAINLAREQGWKPSSLKKEPTLSDKLSFQTTVKNDPWVKDFPIVQRSYRAMVSALDSALKAGADKKSKASADQALITLFNKMLDPTSVVREGEYSRSEQGQSFLQQAQSWVQQAAGGGAKITDESRQEMVNIAKTLYKNSLKDYSTALDSYEAQAVDSGIDPSVYLRRNDLEELKPKANPPQGQIWVKEIGGGVGSIPSKEFDPKKFIKL